MSLNDDLSIALFSCSILIVLDHISELSSFIVTYHSDKWNVYEISDSSRLIIALCLNLLVFYIHDLFTLCMKIYLSTFIITYVRGAFRIVGLGTMPRNIFVFFLSKRSDTQKLGEMDHTLSKFLFSCANLL